MSISRITTSGARIVAISVDAAEAFLARLGERAPGDIAVAFAAVEDNGPMIGVGIIGTGAADDDRVMVAVAPERRRLHIGSDLLDALADEAVQRGIRHLRVSYRSDASLTDAFVHGCGLLASRRVVSGVVTALLSTARTA